MQYVCFVTETLRKIETVSILTVSVWIEPIHFQCTVSVSFQCQLW